MIRKALLAASMGFLMLTAIPAHASNHGLHCGYELQPLWRRAHVIRAKLVPVGCYDSRRQLRSLAREDTDVMIGTEFNLNNYNGASKDYFAANTCQGDTWEVSLSGTAQNDTFQSGKGFGGCDHNKKFAGPSFGGNSLTCTPNCTGYGSLDNDVSSLRWKP